MEAVRDFEPEKEGEYGILVDGCTG